MTEGELKLPPVINLGLIDCEPVCDERTAKLAGERVEQRLRDFITTWNNRARKD